MLLAKKQNVDRQQIADLFHFYQTNKEQTYQDQMIDYYKKTDEQMLHICFCGHFSAGKSTLINHLMEDDLLPQSPIPTSANIVEIKNGKERVIVHFTKQTPIEMPMLPPIDNLHQLCRDGEEIKKIEIYKNIKDLPNGVTIMDTPGIDASNDADRVLTESSLHQVDVLFYVMDYNHVQSEVNASFLKQLHEMNKPYYVIINQMDKHDESEITISAFKQSLDNVFSQWEIKPNDVFFTTMTDKQTNINQFPHLQQKFYEILANKAHLFNETLHYGIEFSIEKSMQDKRKETDDHIQQIEEEIAEIKLPDDTTLKGTEDKAHQYKNELENLEKEYSLLIDKTTKNAPIIPYEVRDKARMLLEAYEPKFKVGIFRNQKKISEERERRLNSFYWLLKEKAEVGIEWKLREKVSEFLRPYYVVHFTEPIFEQYIRKETLLSFMNEGATVNGEYILNYTDQISQATRKAFRQYYKNQWNELVDNILTPVRINYEAQKELLALFNLMNTLQTKVEKEKENYEAYINKLEIIKDNKDSTSTNHIEKMEQLIASKPIKQETDIQGFFTQKDKTSVIEKQKDTKKLSDNLFSYQQTLADVHHVLEDIKEFSGLDKMRQELLQKQSRLTNRHFTIALFGAFSAGKSSFANALIGEKVLPVSPNPTTAAINKISPVKQPYQHKDVSILVKSEKQLLVDLGMILDKEFHKLDEVYKWLKKTKIEKMTISDQHKSFLFAFLKGYIQMKENIGKSYVIDFDDFHHYVQEESIACFVKEMELFYDCPLTRHHITLVDTPGADSVNARHTDLAFSYIKDADAILFVTYYNHPFSKPDKNFLERLGQVKDAFELDKMFFIINAIDLAKNEQEKQMVIDYVSNELSQLDINNPRIFALSSKMAQTTNSESSGLPKFEESFFRFIQEELTQMSMHAIYSDIGRIKGLIANWLSIVNGNQSEKEQLIEKNRAHQLEIEAIIENRDHISYLEQVKQKLNKQTFFIIQRFEIQFTDVWKDHIHPGVIQSSGRKGKKELEGAIHALGKSIHQRLQTEYEALAIRLEQTWNLANQQLRDDLAKEIKQIDEHVSLSEFEFIHLPIPNVEIRKIELEKNKLSEWLPFYKDSKSFFAENGRQILMEQVSSYFIAEWGKCMNQLESSLHPFYQYMWEEKNTIIWNLHLEEVQDYYQQIVEGMKEQEGNKEGLENMYSTLDNILKHK